MRIEPELAEVVNGQRGILRGTEVCLDHECLVSAVALIFFGIDSLSALARPVEMPDTSRSVFIDWVERYLLPSSGMACTALDLYAARCGALHTHSPESDLQRQGKANRLVYEWKHGPAADATLPLSPGTIVIEIETLHKALKRAVEKFFITADTDPETKERVYHHLGGLLCYKPWPVLMGTVAR